MNIPQKTWTILPIKVALLWLLPHATLAQGPNASAQIVARLDKATVPGGNQVTLTISASQVSGLTAYWAEVLFDSRAVEDPTYSNLLPGFMAIPPTLESITSLPGYNRRAQGQAGSFLPLMSSTTTTGIGTFTFKTKAGFSSASFGIRHLVLRAGSQTDTIKASPSPLVLRITERTGSYGPNVSATIVTRVSKASVPAGEQVTLTISASKFTDLTAYSTEVLYNSAAVEDPLVNNKLWGFLPTAVPPETFTAVAGYNRRTQPAAAQLVPNPQTSANERELATLTFRTKPGFSSASFGIPLLILKAGAAIDTLQAAPSPLVVSITQGTGVPGPPLEGPNAGAKVFAALHRSTGIKGGEKVVLTISARPLAQLYAYYAEVVFNPGDFEDPRALNLPTTFTGSPAQSRTIVDLPDYSRIAAAGADLLAATIFTATPLNSSQRVDLARFEFTARPGFTSSSLGIRRLVLGSGSQADEVRPSPSPLVLQVNAATAPPLKSPDVEQDGVVDYTDLFLLADGFGRNHTDAKFDPYLDLNGDGRVGAWDFLFFASRFGQRAPNITITPPTSPGPNSSVTFSASLDKTKGVQAGDKVKLTVTAARLSGATAAVAEVLFDPASLEDPVASGLLPMASGMKAISETMSDLKGFTRRSEAANGIMGGSPVNGSSGVAAFEFTAKAGFTETQIGIRRLVLAAGPQIDTVVASPSPLVLRINASELPAGIAGDPSGDGLVNAGDAILILQHSVGLITLAPEKKPLADVNGDGLVNAGDAILVLQKSVGLIASFPAQGLGKPMAGIRNRESGTPGPRESLMGEGGAILELGQASPIGDGVREVPVILGSGVQGGDLRLACDATVNRITQVKGPEGVLVVSSSADPGEVLVSFARAYASGQAVLRITLNQESGLPADGPVLRVTGQVFGRDGLPAGEVERVLDRPLTPSFKVYPNPFNPSTTIHYALSDAAEVRFVIYSVSGQAVRELVSGRQAAGRYSVVWDGRDDAGRPVSSGVYVGRIRAGVFRESQKMVLLK